MATTRDTTQRRRVLLVEDDEDVAEVVGVMLRSIGHVVVRAGGGRDALTMVAAFDPEIAFIDLGLPDMDGFEVARALRVAADRRRPLICALTGSAHPKAWEEAAEAGFDQYLVKPTTSRELSMVIERHPTTSQRRRRADAAAGH
jgi:DNA-binding response OmpR family regulator